MMKIVFTPEALAMVHFISNSESPVNGFVLGNEIGKYKIISGFIPFRLNKKNVNRLYSNFYEKFGTKLKGIFFFNGDLFLNDWFIDDLIIKIYQPRIKIFYYNGLENVFLKEIIINGGKKAIK